MKSTERGVALPIVILFTALILVGVMVSTSYTLLGGTNRNASESRATASLFAADSLVNRLDSAAAALPPFTGEMTATALLNYLTLHQLTTLTLPNQATATVEVAKVDTTANPKVVGWPQKLDDFE